jgi:RHH-type proline utilization regulon transcriptional repressor/proline dehydrogenase/delta 1-pyrroline-5-carboxylate dehydrogenase
MLEEGEEWLLEPKQDPENPQLWSPGIKWGVKSSSFSYQNELFGPVLGVMRADNLEHAIALVNGTSYGLTSGIHSLDTRELQYWNENVEVGNMYINRGITGAVVRRQPFGGCKDSSFGIGIKAGGPNYLLGLMDPEESRNSDEGSYIDYMINHFSQGHDPSQVLGQDNIFSYVPRTKMAFRVQSSDNPQDVKRVLKAARVCNAEMLVSDHKLETDEQFIERLKEGRLSRVRLISEPTKELMKALAEMSCSVIRTPVISNGRIELVHYMREVSLSVDYHRYGNLGERE